MGRGEEHIDKSAAARIKRFPALTGGTPWSEVVGWREEVHPWMSG